MTTFQENLIRAYPQIQRHTNDLYLVKYGGAAMERPEVRDAICEEIAGLSTLGIKIVVVHGGGKEISKTLNRLSIPSNFISGLRVTNSEAISAIEMVLSGSINKDLTSRIGRFGSLAIGISGRDARTLIGARLTGPNGEDLGCTGDVSVCNPGAIRALLESGLIPVISPVAETDSGEALNINADYAAATIAGALGVSACIFLTDVAGVIDAGRIIESITPKEIEDLIANGVITGGMIPKVECALRALRLGCSKAIICNAINHYAISQAILGNLDSGTVVRE